MEVGQKRHLDSSKIVGGPSLPKTFRSTLDASPTVQKSTIRVRDNLTSSSVSIANSSSALETEIKVLKEEIRALTWLARKKEQEWDATLRLLNQKKDRLMRSERQHSLEKSAQIQFLKSASNDVDEAVSPDVGPIPEINNHKFQSADQLSSYFSLNKSLTMLKDTSGLPIVIKVLPEPVATPLPPYVQLPNTPLPSSSLMSTNGQNSTPTIVSTTSLAGLTSDNDDIEIIETAAAGKSHHLTNAIFKMSPETSQAANARTNISHTLVLPQTVKTRIFSAATPFQPSKLISSSTTGSSSGSTSTTQISPISSKVVGSKPISLLVSKNLLKTTAAAVTSSTTSSSSVLVKAASSTLQLMPSTAKSTVAATVSTSVQKAQATVPSAASTTVSSSSTAVTSGTAPTVNLKCEFCKIKPSQFLCAGCSNRSYCSRNCQEKDWDSHCDSCA